MRRWEFFDMASGQPIGSFPDRARRSWMYETALVNAAVSFVPNPIFSHYHVRESVMSAQRGGEPVFAGNIEYGLCQALHGEESAVAAFRSRVDGRTDNEPKVLAVIVPPESLTIAPCGNCRDILRQEFGPDTEIVAGSADGGKAMVARLADFLGRDSQPINYISPILQGEVEQCVRDGEYILNDVYSPSRAYPQRHYYAMIVTPLHRWIGAHDIMCDYHPTYALEDAVRQARRAHDPFIDHVVIVGYRQGLSPIPDIPDVMFRDRQRLYELNMYQEYFNGRTYNPLVYLVSDVDDSGKRRMGVTSTKEWLPYPFSPTLFGPQFMAEFRKHAHKHVDPHHQPLRRK